MTHPVSHPRAPVRATAARSAARSAVRAAARAPRRPAARSEREAAVITALTGIRRLERALRLAARRIESVARLSAAQLFVLEQLAVAPAESLNGLALRTLTDRSSVSAVVDRLAELGLVSRRSDRADRRRQRIRITAAGRRMLVTASPSPTTLLIAGLRQLARDELAGVASGLTRLNEAMGLAGRRAPMLFDDGPEETR
ncbi:MAG TPA: MarR family transcriptional regulator [Gemmatimonadaceae bacterium]